MGSLQRRKPRSFGSLTIEMPTPPCYGRMPYEPSEVAVFPSVKNEFFGKIENIFLKIFQTIFIAI